MKPQFATAETFEEIRALMNQIGGPFISTRAAQQARSDELDRREKLLEEKESKLEAIEEAITEKLLEFEERKRQLESIEGLISEKSKEFDSLRKRERTKMEQMEREVVERLRSKEKAMNVSVDRLNRMTRNVEECVNEAKRRKREVEERVRVMEMREREVEERVRIVENREREVEELRKNVELKEKGLREMDERLEKENKRAMDKVIKTAEEGAIALEERVRSLGVRGEELERKEMELKEQEEALKRSQVMIQQQLECARRANNNRPFVTNVISSLVKAEQPDSSTSDNAASLLPSNLQPIATGDHVHVLGSLNETNFKQNPHLNVAANHAMYLALEWKEKMMGNPGNSAESFAFILFLATYGILHLLNIDETIKLLGLISQSKRALELCQTPVFAVGITDVIRNLIEKKRLVEAVKCICMFKLSDKLPLASLLEKYVQEAMKCLDTISGSRSTDEKVQFLENRMAEVRALVQCVKNHNLGSKDPTGVIDIQVAQLEALEEKWTCYMSYLRPTIVGQQNLRKRTKHDFST